jgi:hypothetical protein
MPTLLPCTHCARHIRRNESACPFCGGAVDLSLAPEPLLPTRRIGRGTTMAFASVLASGCGVAHTTDAGPMDATTMHDAGLDARLLGAPDVGYGQPDVGRDMGVDDANDDGGAP